MSDVDTAALTPDFVFPEGADVADLDLGPFGAIMPMLMGMIGPALAEMNDPDRTTLDDLAESLDQLHEKADWLVAVIQQAGPKLGKLIGTLPPFPLPTTG